MIAFLSALERELAELKKGMDDRGLRKLRMATVAEGSVSGRHVLLVTTGVGRRRATQAAEDLLEAYAPEAVVSLGYGGALVPDLRAGDLVVSPRIRLAETSETVVSYPSDSRLLDLASRAGSGPIHFADGVTAAMVIATEEAKQGLAHRWSAAVVDMESYWVAETAAARGVPFLAVRAISDTLEDKLPDLVKMIDADGNLKALEAGRHLSVHPGEAGRLLKFARNAALARRALGRFGLAFTSVYAQASSLDEAKA
ncbi:MAG: hypothetical protein HY677_07035 [Chloroflexi bacterium]|nr:hypothetical protein [Chloroflexota bacterium]